MISLQLVISDYTESERLQPRRVGPPEFESGSNGPQPSSIGQANLRAPYGVCWNLFDNSLSVDYQGSRVMLNGATSWSRSRCETNIRLQQYLSRPKSFITSAASSPASVLLWYCSHKWPIMPPQLKHLTGNNIFFHLIGNSSDAFSVRRGPADVWILFDADRLRAEYDHIADTHHVIPHRCPLHRRCNAPARVPSQS